MIIRNIEENDHVDIEKIHKQYQQEFELPNFNDKFLSTIIVSTDNHEIITVGGVRIILESVIMTDRTFSVRDRREALYHMLQASLFTCGRLNYHELHAFIQDETWMKHLLKVGFRPTKGKALVIGL